MKAITSYHLIVLLFCIFCSNASGQQLYYCSTNAFPSPFGQSDIGIIDLVNGCDTTVLAALNVSLTDICFDAEGNLYGCSWDSLYLIDFDNNQAISLGGLPGAESNVAVYNGLVCSNENIIYASGVGVFCRYTISSGQFEYLAAPSAEADGSLAGLTFRGCKLIANTQLLDEALFISRLLELDPEGVEENIFISQDPVDTTSSHSIATIYSDCNTSTTFISELSLPNWGYFLYNVDETDLSYSYFCTLNGSYLCINGLASPTEALQPSYRPITDLDTNDSTTPPGSLDYHAPPGCTTPVAIADLDVTIDICHGVDSVRVWLIDGITDGSAETLNTTPTTGITIQGNNSHHLLLVNDSTATNDDFAALLSGTLYSNNTPTPTSGLRQVAVVGYCGYFPGDTAYAYITLEALPQAGGNGQLFLCPDDDPITLTDYLSGNPDPNGEWQPGTAGGSGIFNPTLDGEGSYYYIVGEPGCPQDTAEVMVDLLETPFFELSGSHWLCDGESALLESPITALQYQWQDGSADPTMVVTAPGWYWLEVTNADGCTWRDSVEVFGASTFQQMEMAAICTGENYLFEGALLESDTSLCMTYTTWQGCDSVRCLELVVTPVLLSETEATLCQGDSLYFAGTIVSESGYYVDSLLSQLGCDSVSALLLEVVPRPMLDTDTIWLLPESGQLTLDGGSGFALYHWSTGDTGHTLPVVDPGQYGLTVADENGCTTTTTLMVNRRADYYIPNAFSPNGDGINDYFTMYPGRSVHRVSHLRIYGRWGEEVYGASTLLLDLESRGWDGRFEGKPCPNGVYLYWLEVLYEDGRQEQMTGDVVLLR